MKLLCATDLQPNSEAAVSRAFQLRDALDTSLTLMHVVSPVGAAEGTLEQRLLSASSRLAHRARHSGPGTRLTVRCGRPSTLVSEEAKDADLVIIGPHRGGPLADVLRGTFTERLLADARRPVLLARGSGSAPYRKVLLALDGSSSTAQILRMAERLPMVADAEHAVVHAHEPPYEAMMHSVGVGSVNVVSYASASMSQAATMINAALLRYSRDPRRYRVMLMDARPATAIRQAMREVNPDLLVLGTRGHGRVRRALLGSTAHELMTRAECDVLLVPDAAGAAVQSGDDDPGPAAA